MCSQTLHTHAFPCLSLCVYSVVYIVDHTTLYCAHRGKFYAHMFALTLGGNAPTQPNAYFTRKG